ncbi:carbohydrate ABC transporter permease [Paenibacillus contaminans]|uniref:Carbohydrate ABC transporter permease n=2 Tax=Paenibacillus contaminans TaxID=450362 RepID=A0A329MS54_9BACL|nr:carbohydrate ABC transporter permease [Paenibacillus contaminans]
MWVAMAVTLYPFLYVFSMSISDPQYVISQAVWLLPKGFSLGAYQRIFENEGVWVAYANTVLYTVAGTAVNVVMTMLAAYPLSRRMFFARNWIMIFITFTMFFGGGLIPSFLLIKELGLYDSRWVMIIPGAVSAFLIIIARTFLQSIPEELMESAKLDGAHDFVILAKIVIPLSKPIIAVLALFYAVGHWNSFLTAMIYLPSAELQPLQLFLMKMLIQDADASMLQDMADAHERSLISIQIKYAMIIVAILPILFVYPFLQKHFAKGVLIGSLKE